MKPIEIMLDKSVSCLKCGTKGYMNCDCYIECYCGWLYDRVGSCSNPKHNNKVRKLKQKV